MSVVEKPGSPRGAAGRPKSRASWSGRLLDDASDQYRRPASHWPLLLEVPRKIAPEMTTARESRGGGTAERARDEREAKPSLGNDNDDERADLPSILS